jgi:hypothetical protein
MTAGKGKGRGVVAPPKGKGRKGQKRSTVKPAARSLAPVVDLARERRIADAVAALGDLVGGGAVDAARTRAMLAGELEARPVTDDPDVSTSIRLPGSLLTRADALAALLPVPTGGKLTRSGVIRAALERGLSGLEADAARATSTATPPDLSGVLAELDALRARVEALTVPAPPPKRAGLDPCNVIRPAAEHPGYCRCGHPVAAHVAVYGADGVLVDLRAAPLSELCPILSTVAHVDPLSVACPKCPAAVGFPCLSGGRALVGVVGSPFLPSHPDRLNAARR